MRRLLLLAAFAAAGGTAPAAAGGAWTPAVYEYGQAYSPTSPRGYGVVAIKRELIYRSYGRGINPALPVYGWSVRERVKEFQRAKNLAVTGKVGIVTARVLFRARQRILEGRYRIPQELLCKVTDLESAHDPGAVGVDGNDRGLVQVNRLAHPTITDPLAYDPAYALDWAADRLRDAYLRFGDWEVAVAAHNGGYGGAAAWQAAGKPADTTLGRYVQLVYSRVCSSVLGVSSVNVAGELAPTSSCPTTSATQMLCLTNYARRVNGLPRLAARTTDGTLNLLYRSASLKADRLLACSAFTHTPCGDPADRQLRQAGIPAGGWWGENLAVGWATIRETFQAWLESPGHRANILRPQFRWYGSAFRTDASGMCTGCRRLWVIHFGG